MDNRAPYEESVEKALRKIAAHVPEDLVQQFAEKSGITIDQIHPIPRIPSGTVSAIDGSNAMVLDGGSVALAAIRAARTTFTGRLFVSPVVESACVESHVSFHALPS